MRMVQVILAISFLAAAELGSAAGSEPRRYDVVIYGATPGGIAAAVAAGKSGRSVLLVEPTQRIGGMVTSGLSHTDFHSLESLTGAFLDFASRVESHYAETYGPDSEQVRDSFHGTFAEPKVNLAVFRDLLAEQKTVQLQRQYRLVAVSTRPAGTRREIDVATFEGPRDRVLRVAGDVFIDASYEGDLMAEAGAAWTVGREARRQYGESLAPQEADGQLQAYNFRFIMTRDPDNRVKPRAPDGYRREDFVGVLDALHSGQIKRVFDYPSRCIFKAHLPPLPGDKYDINDVSRGPVRLSLPGKNLAWPDGDHRQRQAVFAEHVRDQVGLLYFLQNDPEVPEPFRDEAAQWGWCRDEFEDSDHLPPQLYVREARRMQGQYVYTQKDSEFAANDVRAVLHRDSIAMADYGNNCHGTDHEGGRFEGRHTGEFYNPVPPYQIPYGVMVSRELDNLLVPVAVSASHVGFCALRLEPIWMSLGQAAGHAASLASEDDQAVQDVSVLRLQRRLHADGSATIYVSDVLPGHPDFPAVQWWATAGGLHGLFPADHPRRARGEKLHGQYSKAAPNHAAELDKPLAGALEQRWRKLADALAVPAAALPVSGPELTRGQFIRAAAAAVLSAGAQEPDPQTADAKPTADTRQPASVQDEVTLNHKADGYRGIWYMNQPSGDQYVYKYSGGLGTYCAKHRPFAIYCAEVNKTFFCYGGAPAGNSRQLLHMVSYFDHETKTVPRPTILLDKHTDDAHDNPVISIDEEGYVWIFSTSHGRARPSYIHRSTEPYQIDRFERVAATRETDQGPEPITNFSYMQVWNDSSGFQAFFTRYNYPAARTICFMNSRDGRRWSAWQRLAAIDQGHYQISGSGRQALGTMFNYHPEGKGLNWRTNLYYMHSVDNGATWQNVHGETLSPPLTRVDNPALVHDYESEGLNVYLKDLRYDSKDRPVLLYITSKGYQSGPRNDPRTWRLARWTGQQWKVTSITTSDNNYDFGELWMLADDDWRVIGPTETGPQPYNPGGEIAMWQSTDQGDSWRQLGQLTRDSPMNHTYVRRALNSHPDFLAIWADGHGRQPSDSRLYIANADGEVFRLPVTMEGERARPEPIP